MGRVLRGGLLLVVVVGVGGEEWKGEGGIGNRKQERK